MLTGKQWTMRWFCIATKLFVPSLHQPPLFMLGLCHLKLSSDRHQMVARNIIVCLVILHHLKPNTPPSFSKPLQYFSLLLIQLHSNQTNLPLQWKGNHDMGCQELCYKKTNGFMHMPLLKWNHDSVLERGCKIRQEYQGLIKHC